MGMTIDKAIEKLSASILIIGPEDWDEARDILVSTTRKYEKIKQIIDNWENSGEDDDPINIIDNIEEVLEDGNN